MNHKKVILVVILFIGISFIVYSFANPLSEEESMGNGDTGIQEDGNSDPSIGGNDIIDNDIPNDNTPENPDDNEIPNEIPADKTDEKEENGSNNLVIQKPTVITPSTNNTQTKPTVTPDTTIPTLTVSNYSGTVGDNKAITSLYKVTYGRTGGNTTCKNGSTTITNVNQLKTQGTYQIVCTATGKNGKSISKTLHITVKPVINATAKGVKPVLTQYESGISDKVYRVEVPKVIQNKFDITVNGTIIEQEYLTSLETNRYFALDYLAYGKLTDEQLSKATFYVENVRITNPELGTTADGKTFVRINLGFMTGDVFKVKIDWGDGYGAYTYNVKYNINMITVNEIDKIFQQQVSEN